jgi:8-amino-7-oxononanoate synthase
VSRFDQRYQAELERRAATHNLRQLQVFDPIGPVRIRRNGRELINFCSNNYLGLSHHPEVIARARRWGERWGCGSGASGLVTGHLVPHATIERKVAKLKGTEAALLFASGFQANSSLLPALFSRRTLGSDPIVLADALIHASLHQGCAAGRVKPILFRHNDLNQLEELLVANERAALRVSF